MRRIIISFVFIFTCITLAFSQTKPRIAIIPLNALGISEEEAATASNLLETALVQTNMFTVIEQNQVNIIIEAQSFSLSGNTDEAYATKIGNLLSAEQIAIGSFSHIGEEFILNVKIIIVETGQNIRAEKVSFKSMDELSNSIDQLANKLIDQHPEVIKNEMVSIKEQVPDSTKTRSNTYIYQIGLGSAYSIYFFDIQNLLDSMNESSLSRIPFNINFLFGKKMSETIAWTVTLTTGLDIFSASPDSLQIYTINLSGGFQYIPFKTGLTTGINAGFSILIPNTNLSYKGSTEIGSSVSLDLGYTFETLKFSKFGIIPGIEFKFIHSEMFRGSVNQICGYINLGIR